MNIDIQNLQTKMQAEKEFLSTLPTNTKNNKAKYVEKLQELKNQYEMIKDDIYKEMIYIYRQKTALEEENDELKLQQMQEIEKVENVIDNTKTLYEKTGIDKAIFNLKRFYKKDINIVNKDIREAILLFKNVGIDLAWSEFNFTPYTAEYMKIFFEELNKPEMDLQKLKKEFERVYWKSPDLIIHIELNFRYIFLKKEKDIRKVYKWQTDRVYNKLKVSKDEIYSRYNEIRRKYIENQKSSKRNIINKFLDGYWNVKDYEEKNIEKTYSKFVSLELWKNNEVEIDSAIISLLHNLYEYESYIKFKFVFDDIRKIYKQEPSKETYQSLKKKILEKCSKITANKIIKINKNEEENKNNEIRQLVDLFEKLDALEIEEQIKRNLTPHTTLKEMAKFILPYYKYLFMCMIKNNKEITEKEILEQIAEFKEFVKYPYNTISASILLEENQNIPLMISDRYNLVNIKVERESLEKSNIRDLVIELEKLENYSYIKKENIDLNEINDLCKVKKIWVKNK